MTRPSTGCAFGRESRVMIDDMRREISEIKVLISDVKKGQTDLFNHQSTRVPQETVEKMLSQSSQIKWLYGILGTIIGGTIVGVIIFLITNH